MANRDKKVKPAWMDYHPHRRELDIEIFPFSDLRRRGPRSQIKVPHRYTFYVLVCITGGEVVQTVDFTPVDCTTGSVLVLRPGQVHNFGSDEGWEGWLVFFRSEFLPTATETTSDLIPAVGLDRLPSHLRLCEADFAVVTGTIARMQLDVACNAPPKDVHTLVRHQLSALCLRLMILYEQQPDITPVGRNSVQRFAGFRRLVEQNFSGWHQVAPYAEALGCTERSLLRAAMAAAGMTAKDVITARLVLEAKRLLAHTEMPVYVISESLGFDEPTNFAKFFRREAGDAPLRFRHRHSLGIDS